MAFHSSTSMCDMTWLAGKYMGPTCPAAPAFASTTQVELLQTAFTSLADAVLEELGESVFAGVGKWIQHTYSCFCHHGMMLSGRVADCPCGLVCPIWLPGCLRADTLGTERVKAQKEQAAHTQCLRELEDRVQVMTATDSCVCMCVSRQLL